MEKYWINQYSEYIQQCILKLPLPVIQKLQLMRMYHNVAKPVNKILKRHRDYGEIPFQPLINSNQFFGNEYLLRRYAGMNEDLFAIIEHGLYFGNNKKKIPSELEWALGCILTYGEYRKKLINQVYPDYYCETIGAPILYADSEEEYQQKIKATFQMSGNILLFFPAHGLEFLAPVFNFDNLSNQLLSLARDNGCDNIVISTFLSKADNKLYQFLKNKAKEIKIFVYCCGTRNDQEFLFRQRALISLSTVTASNSLGTHVGNCVGLQKPHVILKQKVTYEGNTEREFGEKIRSANWKEQFAIEQDLFEKTFSYHPGQLTLTDEQYKLCDYYWGFSKKRTPDEIREIYRICHEYAHEFIKRNN